jgi:serine/threonine protein phosphatase PrpC
LTRHVKADEIAQLAMKHDSPDDIASALIDLANKRGGEDNISVVVILMERAQDVKPEEPPDPLLFGDTDIGLYQAPDVETTPTDQPTMELPSVKPDEEEEG